MVALFVSATVCFFTAGIPSSEQDGNVVASPPDPGLL